MTRDKRIGDNMKNTLVIDNIASLYGFESKHLKEIKGGFQNTVYEVEHGDETLIVRLTPSHRRSYENIKAELNFILLAHDNGVSVAKPLKLNDKEYIETIQGDLTYYCVVFERALGEHLSYPEYLADDSYYYQIGLMLGKLHKASRRIPLDAGRFHYRDNAYIKKYLDTIPDSELHAPFVSILEEISQLPIREGQYGLIHGDVNVGNFFSDGKSLTLFDFDECQYSWYVEDIAIALYYTVYVFGDDAKEERDKKCNQFMQAFLKGYREHSEISKEELMWIPKFLVLREMIVHVGIHDNWDMDNLSGWAKDYHGYSHDRVLNKRSIVDYSHQWWDASS